MLFSLASWVENWLEEARATVRRWMPESGRVNGTVFKRVCPLAAPLLHPPPNYFSAGWKLLCIHQESRHRAVLRLLSLAPAYSAACPVQTLIYCVMHGLTFFHSHKCTAFFFHLTRTGLLVTGIYFHLDHSFSRLYSSPLVNCFSSSFLINHSFLRAAYPVR